MTTQEKAVQELAHNIKLQTGQILNKRMLLGSIESFGIRDIDVACDYGFENIEELTNFIFKQFQTESTIGLKNFEQKIEEETQRLALRKIENLIQKKVISAHEYLLGLLHSIPIFIQVVAIILFGFSLWGYIRFNEVQATAVVLGVIIGFVSSAGFIQVLGKQVAFFWYRKDWHLVKISITHIIKTYMKWIALIVILGLGLNFVIPVYPLSFLAITFCYGFVIGYLLLTLAPLYTMNYRWVISAIISLGTIISILIFRYINWPIYVIHLVSILFCIALGALSIRFILQKRIKEKGNQTTGLEPEMMMSVYHNFYYFLYGTLIFIFIFSDRIIAWSSPKQHDLPFAIYYQQEYEIGMDLAIIVFFLLMGALEYSVSSFTRYLDYNQQRLSILELKKLRKGVKSLYYKHLRVFFISSLIIGFLIYLIISQPWGYQSAFQEPLSAISLKVCILGSFGYLFLIIGMLNVLYLFTLNNNKSAVINITIAFMVNLILGIICSRIISYEYSVVGMLVGSLVFMVLTTISVMKYFNNIEYHYYASY